MLVFIGGLFLSLIVTALAQRFLASRTLEVPSKRMLVALAWSMAVAVTLVLSLAKIGLTVGPLIVGIGLIGLVLGLTMTTSTGVLSNVTSGIFICLTRSIRVGQNINLLGFSGRVHAFSLSFTNLHTENSTTLIPNRKVVEEILHNRVSIPQDTLKKIIPFNKSSP